MFQDSPFNIVNVLHSLSCWARSIKQRLGNSSGSIMNRNRYQRWVPLPPSSFKLNADGDRNSTLGLSCLAVVARDEHGRWMWGIRRNIGRCNLEQVEL